MQARHLFAERLRLSPVPTVRHDEHDGPPAQRPARPSEVELPERRSDARPARPVRHRLGDLAYGLVYVTLSQLFCDARQPRGEEERLHPALQSSVEAVDEVKQHAGVALHRAADVADDHQPAGFLLAPPGPQMHELAPVLRAVTQGAPHVQRGPSSPLLATG